MKSLRSSRPPMLPGAGNPSLSRLRLGLLLVFFLLSMAVILSAIWVSIREYRHELNQAVQQNVGLARSLDEHAARSFISVEQALDNLGEILTRSNGVDGSNQADMYQMLVSKKALTPQIRGIITIDSQGFIHTHGLEFPARRIDLSDRSYFKFHRSNPDTRSQIGQPVISRTDGKWLIPVTQRVNRPDGSFGGVLLAAVEPAYFLDFYKSLHLTEGQSVRLMLDDGTILLNYPFNDRELGNNERPMMPALSGKQAEGDTLNKEWTDPKTGQTELVSFHEHGGAHPLIVMVSSNKDVLLAKYRQDTLLRIIATLALMLVITGLLYLLFRQIRHAEQVESRLYLTQFTVDHGPDPVLWCDSDGYLSYANQNLIRLAGLDENEWYHLRFTDFLPRITAEKWQSLWSELREKQHLMLETQLRIKDDQLLPVEITLALIEYQATKYLCVTARDISQRIQTQTELRRHRDQLQELVLERTAEVSTVLDASPLAIMLAVQGKIRLVNPAFEILLGFPASDIIGRPTHTIFASASHYTEKRAQISQALLSGGAYRDEIELYRHDHSPFWAMVNIKSLVPGDTSKGEIAVIEDITAQRIAAQTLKQSERLKRTVIDQSADGFLLLNHRQRVVEINPAICLMLGFSREELLDRDPAFLWGEPCFRQVFPKEIQLHPGYNHVGEVTLPTRDGESRPFLINSGAIHADDGKLEHLFAFFTNISQLKEIERHLVDAKEAAEAANQAKSTFLANMSHELRTPMHAILSFSEIGMAKADKVPGPSLIRYFDRIHASGQRLLVLLNDLLDMSRLEANKMQYDKEYCALLDIVQSAANELGGLLSARNLSVHIDESTGQEIAALFDRARITQVVVNVLSNAIKFSPADSAIEVSIQADLRLPSGETAVGILVRDHGPGVPDEELESIFDKFIQSSKLRVDGGTGLGLAISRQIMEDHGGAIIASNHPLGGAIFSLLLPQGAAHGQDLF
ncbi:PAS domain-containing protein [Chitinilyticum piscinae]|uniref:histidine kinase n=1 Tax=Chitinilyticum piscinae TaxID=2866724 RepID=A0A8J7KEA6_9NEIS|nr:PAS domain-containing protein [Chitinilyticum piscinae]MBE9609294.1 PAS domain S-box protein [Chitinilyticum piscinae]